MRNGGVRENILRQAGLKELYGNIFGNSKGNDWEAEHYDVAIMTLSVLDRRMFGAVMRGFAFRCGTFAIVFVVMRIKRAE